MDILALDRFLPYRLNRLAAAMSQDLRGVYALKFELTVPEWRVLATLGECRRITAKGIGAHSAMHKTKVSRAVMALEDRRWLSREPNEQDRREEFLCLTARGQAAYAALVPEMNAYVEGLRLRTTMRRWDSIAAALNDLELLLGLRGQPKAELPPGEKS